MAPGFSRSTPGSKCVLPCLLSLLLVLAWAGVGSCVLQHPDPYIPEGAGGDARPPDPRAHSQDRSHASTSHTPASAAHTYGHAHVREATNRHARLRSHTFAHPQGQGKVGRRWGEGVGRNLSCGPLQDTVLEAEVTMDRLDAMKENYTVAALNLTWEQIDSNLNPANDNKTLQICDEVGKECILVLPSLPPKPHVPPQTEELTKVLMVEVYGYLLRYTVAFETLFLDQSLHQGTFLQQMHELHTSLEDLADELMTPMTSCNLTPDQYLIADLSTRMYHGESVLLRSLRGFCALRQTRLGLQYIMDVFSRA